MKKSAFILICVCVTACNKDKEIKDLLNGPTSVDRIQGCYEAMETDDLSYVPLLLKNSRIQLITTNIRFKGTSVYQADMYSLSKLLKVSPPHPVNRIVDSVNVRFFFNYWEKFQKTHPRKR